MRHVNFEDVTNPAFLRFYFWGSSSILLSNSCKSKFTNEILRMKFHGWLVDHENPENYSPQKFVCIYDMLLLYVLEQNILLLWVWVHLMYYASVISSGFLPLCRRVSNLDDQYSSPCDDWHRVCTCIVPVYMYPFVDDMSLGLSGSKEKPWGPKILLAALDPCITMLHSNVKNVSLLFLIYHLLTIRFINYTVHKTAKCIHTYVW